MPAPGPALSYTSYDKDVLTLYPWSGRQVAVLTASNALNAGDMDQLLDALDRAFDVYVYITGREPSLFKNYNGLLSIAQVPTTFGTNGGALGWLGATGIELSEAVWSRLYNGVAQAGQYDQAVFYEFGRNFWFYGSQLGRVDPFVTGFAIVNRFVSMEQAGLAGSPFNGVLDFSEFRTSILEDLSQTYLSNGAYTLANTIVANAGVASPHNWGAADLAASLLYQVYEDFGLAEYRNFYAALAGLPAAADSAAAINNFLDAARLATGSDYSFLNKPAGMSYVTGGRGADALQSRGDGSPSFGFGGDDAMLGNAGSDRLFGDKGNDTLSGGAGEDRLVGGQGADRLDGGSDNDWLLGGSGEDLLSGGSGADTLAGGAGNDTFHDSMAGLNGDTISDLNRGDQIVIADATLATFMFSLSGNVLTFTGGSLSLNSIPLGAIVATAAAGGEFQLTVTTRDPHNDFNGDGRSDVLWRDSSGAVTNWLGQSNGAFAGNSANAFNQVDTSWRIAGTGDFNGDGRDDIIWRHSGGAVSEWLGQANGGFAGNANVAVSVDTSWRIVGTSDFNGDGRDDILWRHSSGALTNWMGQADGSLVANNNAFHHVDNGWQVAATGDFNGDGRDDIIFRHSSGSVTEWLGQANGGYASNHAVAGAQVGTDWSIISAGDFNGDGRDDVLWRNASGTLTNWLGRIDGGFTNNGAASAVASAAWHVVAIGDYNGDGRDDLAWRHDSGEFSQWLGQANGGFANNHGAAGNQVGVGWQVQSPDLLFL